MISRELAARLRDAGVRWHPRPGDRFVIPQPALSGEVFTLSEMTIEAHEYPTGTVLGFNGTTEWALDSVEKDEALWMPREDQLRDLLGSTFVSLVVAGPSGGAVSPRADGGERGVFAVTTRRSDGEVEAFHGAEPAEAYGLALLALVERAVGVPGT
jgi:hypothetical protein